MTTGRYRSDTNGGTAVDLSRSRTTLLILMLSVGLGLLGCRDWGFYDPVYTQDQLQRIVNEDGGELQSVAQKWLALHKSDSLQYVNRRPERLIVNRFEPYPPGMGIRGAASQTVRVMGDDRFGVTSRSPTGEERYQIVNRSEIDRTVGWDAGTFDHLLQFARKYKLDGLSTLRTSSSDDRWYVQITFQGGGWRWPYGLIYVPEGEPLDLLNAKNGSPGPGFSRLTPIGGRWLYFESAQ